MRLITLHCDYIIFKPVKKALKSAQDLNEEEKKEKEIKDPLVVLTAVEQGDNDKTVKEYIEAIEKTAGEVKAKNLVLYPYAHLSSNLANPDTAKEYMVEAEHTLAKSGFNVTRAPFGYYKEFELKCKGHPLSELSKEFGPLHENKDKTAVIQEAKDKAKGKTPDSSNLLSTINQTKLDTSKLKENDHRILGQKLGLFMFNESSPGSPYWLPNGVLIYNELVNFWRAEHAKLGYQETMTPLMNKKELYHVSGHWDHYKENMFIADMGEDGTYCLKPMNCPNAMLIFKSQTRSYKDLPLRLSDTDRLHRFELSGVLNGLLRVRSFQQDDSHNFISEEMIGSEYEEIFKICEKFYSIFGLKYSFRLGTRPDNFLGEKQVWDKAEETLKSILKKSKKKFAIAEKDGAFYGPKVDILMVDSLGREWQMGTIQLDFQLPKRFDLKYADKEGKLKTPVVIHRVIYGSLERFIGILLEHTNGNLPVWLSPVQCRIINFTDRNTKAAEKILDKIKKELPQLRIDSDFRNTTVNDKVRDSEMQKIPYLITIGDKEEEKGTLAIKKRGEKKPEFGVKLEKFVKEIKEKIENRE